MSTLQTTGCDSLLHYTFAEKTDCGEKCFQIHERWCLFFCIYIVWKGKSVMLLTGVLRPPESFYLSSERHRGHFSVSFIFIPPELCWEFVLCPARYNTSSHSFIAVLFIKLLLNAPHIFTFPWFHRSIEREKFCFLDLAFTLVYIEENILHTSFVVK